MSLRSLTSEVKANLLEIKGVLKSVGWSFIFPVIGDAFFFVLLGFVQSGLVSKIVEYISASGFDIIRNTTLESKYVAPLILLISISLLALFLLYCVYQGTVWWICKSFVRPQNYFAYIKNFTMVSIIWGAAYYLYSAFGLMTSIRESIGGGAVTGIVVALYVFLFILIYFAAISYALIEKSFLATLRNTFKIGILKIVRVLPHLLIIGLVFAVLSILLGFVSDGVLAILQLFVVLPLLSLARIYILIAIPKLKA